MKKRSFTHMQGFNPVKSQMLESVDGSAVVVAGFDAADSGAETGTAPVSRSTSISGGGVAPNAPPSPNANRQKFPNGFDAADSGAEKGTAPVSRSTPIAGGGVASNAPPSPMANRQKFLNGFIPARTCCNLDLCRVPADSKFTITAICMAVFPPSKNPDRRYIQLCDDSGSTGITVWNSNVAKFNSDCVGKLVSCQKVAISSYNGRKTLTMTRDSIVQLVNDAQHPVMCWWSSLLNVAPKSCGAVHDAPDGSMVSVTGILGLVSEEIKMVNSVEKTLTYLHLVDASGRVDIRSWNHSADSFLRFTDSAVCVKRIRVTSFAGTKVLELLDSDSSVIETEFPGKAGLEEFWSS
jgi:hypothetical protein